MEQQTPSIIFPSPKSIDIQQIRLDTTNTPPSQDTISSSVFLSHFQKVIPTTQPPPVNMEPEEAEK